MEFLLIQLTFLNKHLLNFKNQKICNQHIERLLGKALKTKIKV